MAERCILGQSKQSGPDVNLSSETAPLLSGAAQGPHTTTSYHTEDDFSAPSDANQDDTFDFPTDSENHSKQSKNARGTISLLLIGVFVASLDQSVVLTTYGRVASEFHDFESGSWILSAYIIAQCTFQPLYGKLADIFSRKSCLLAAYILCALGILGAGLSRNMVEIIAARAIQGAGAAGMLSVVAIIVTDIVPPRDVAITRSYVNVVQTSAKSSGGLIGGFLAQALGWRWSFLVQMPVILLAIGLLWWAVKLPSLRKTAKESQWDKLKRVDFIGSFWLSTAILMLCLVLDQAGRRPNWTSPWMLGTSGVGVIAAIAFVITASIVKEPVFSLRLLAYWDVVGNYLVTLLVIMSQDSMMTFVPIYFQTTMHASPATAGAHLIPAFLGSMVGGFLAGYWIKRTGRYKCVTVSAPFLAGACILLQLLTWNGKISALESSIIFLGGCAAGVIANSAYVGLVAGVPEEDIAVATSGMYLALELGTVGGVSSGNAAFQAGVRYYLERALASFPNRQKIIKRAGSDLSYVWQTKGDLRHILISGYVHGFHSVNWIGIGCSILALLLALFSRESRLLKGNS